MKIVRVHNPSGLRATKTRRRKNTMASRRRKNTRRRNTRARAAVNPRRRRRRSRRRNPVTIVTRSRRRTVNPRRRRRRGRRRNPSGIAIGGIFKDMVYGAGGAVLTRAISSVAEGFVPGQFMSSQLARPVVQAAAAVIPVRWIGKKFLGQAAADKLMIGGLISAGLALFDSYVPNAQSSLTNLLRAPLNLAPGLAPATQAAVAQGAAQGAVNALNGYRGGVGDVYDVPDSVFAGFGDVEEVPSGIWG